MYVGTEHEQQPEIFNESTTIMQTFLQLHTINISNYFVYTTKFLIESADAECLQLEAS